MFGLPGKAILLENKSLFPLKTLLKGFQVLEGWRIDTEYEDSTVEELKLATVSFSLVL